MAQAFLVGRPLLCTWQLGRCRESHCLFCEQRAESGDPWPDEATCGRILDELDSLGPLILVLEVGSDGLGRAILTDLVARAARRHFVALSSRGWVCSPSAGRRLWEAGAAHVTIELETADPARQAASLGWSSAGARAVATARSLAEQRTQASQVVEIRVGIGPGETEALAGLLASLDDVAGVAVTVEPRLGERDPAGGTEALGVSLVDLKRRSSTLASPVGFLRQVDAAMGRGISDCAAGRRFLHIDHQGRVSRCNRHLATREGLGSLVGDGHKAVLASLARLSNECRECWSPVRGEMEALRSWRGVLDGIGHLLRR